MVLIPPIQWLSGADQFQPPDVITVPIIPPSLQPYDEPSAGYQDFDKALKCLQLEAYWVGLAHDVENYCRECLKWQQIKQSLPSKAPLVSLPIGKPREMIAVDVLQVLMSYQHNKYLLVVQDYFTKWAEAIPMPDQTAVRLAQEFIKIFLAVGIPRIVHSDAVELCASSDSTTLERCPLAIFIMIGDLTLSIFQPLSHRWLSLPAVGLKSQIISPFVNLVTLPEEGNVSSKTTVQLVSKLTIKCECSHKPRRTFKSARELLVSARTSLAELLLANYLCVCTTTVQLASKFT